MKIFYDYQIFNQQKFGGISRYFSELMNQYSRDPGISFSLGLKYTYNENLLNKPDLNNYWSHQGSFLSQNPIIKSFYSKTNIDPLHYIRINENESIKVLKKQDFDVFHPTYYSRYFLKNLQNKPYVLTIYDMIHELYPFFFTHKDSTKLLKRELIKKAAAIITISENTKSDIIQLTDTDPDTILVTYLGNPFENRIGSEITDISFLSQWQEKRYLLFVGIRKGYKNFHFLIRSLAGLLSESHDLFLVCAGGGPFTPQETLQLKKLNLVHKVYYVPVNESLIRLLYRNAEAFIYPSLYEGFGLPILEAFSCECPAILSNNSSLPEIGGDAALYIDPQDGESIQDSVERILNDKDLSKKLISKGNERLKFFSWKKTAECTKKVYEKIL